MEEGNDPALQDALVRKAWCALEKGLAGRYADPGVAGGTDSPKPASVRFHPWFCIGPFKDAPHGLFSRSWETEFPPEKSARESLCGAPDLDAAYPAPDYPGWRMETLRWREQPDWTNGFYHLLPTGPPPRRNETVYLYRCIHSDQPATVTTELLAEDAMRVWLNGALVGEAYVREGAGRNKRFLAVALPLEPGENHLLVKIVSMFGRHGFAFAFPPIAPTDVYRPDGGGSYFDPMDRGVGGDLEPPLNLPYARFNHAEPAGADVGKRWLQTGEGWRRWLVDRVQQRGAPPPLFQPWSSPVMSQADGPLRVRVRVSGLDHLWLVCGTTADGYDYDDTIWGSPVVVDAEGTTVSLTELEPLSAEVGFSRLHANENLNGQPLQIGSETFAKGYWAHAPSALCFALGGRYEWFEAVVGLDALARASGSATFSIPFEPDPQKHFAAIVDRAITTGIPDNAGVVGALLSEAARGELVRERRDGLWDRFVTTRDVSDLSDAYLARCLEICRPDEASAAEVREACRGLDLNHLAGLFHRAADSLILLQQLQDFRFCVEPVPLYDPPDLEMAEILAGLSGGGELTQRWELALSSIAPRIARIHDSAQGEAPGWVDQAQQAANDLRAAWQGICASLPPLVFVRRPLLDVNAVSPYETAPRGPADLCVFDPSRPEIPPRVLHTEPDGEGSIFDANLTPDGKTVFFSASRPGIEGGWHIYSIDVNGENFRQLTSGPCNDISPLPLPDGRFLFVSNRAGNVLVCQSPRAGVLYLADADGSSIRRVSGNTLSDHTPQLMDDGRVLFTRWDYGVDKGVFMRQGLWTVNPDGTRLQLFYGNTIEDPNSFWQARPVPGRPEVLCIFGPHHLHQAGMLGLVWNRLGVEAPRGQGLRYVTTEIPSFYDASFRRGYQHPFPIDEGLYLASYGADAPPRNRIYVIDRFGNRHCLLDDAESCWNPLLLRSRDPVHRIPNLCADQTFQNLDPVEANRRPSTATATVFLQDVAEGIERYVTRTEVAALQILEQVPKTRPHTGGYAWNVTPTIGRGTFYVRRLVGEVPVARDGSVYFTVPAGRDVSFNLLDAEGRALHRMGSTTQFMPGEVFGCVGCHEPRDSAPPAGRRGEASSAEPTVPVRPDWGTNGIIDFCRVVQPVVDAHCVRCHSGPAPAALLDLSADKTRYFNMAYNQLVDRGLVHHIPMNGADHDHTTPKTLGALVSPLREYLESDHSGAPAPLRERRRIYTWIDANIPYYGSYLYTDGDVNGARDRWYARREDWWFRRGFLPVFERRCAECHERRVDISEAWLGRVEYAVTSRVWTDTTLMDQGLHIEPYIRRVGPAYRINLTRPENSAALLAPLSADAGGWGLCRGKDGSAVFASEAEPDYQKILQALREGADVLLRNPRIDMAAPDQLRVGPGYGPALIP